MSSKVFTLHTCKIWTDWAHILDVRVLDEYMGENRDFQFDHPPWTARNLAHRDTILLDNLAQTKDEKWSGGVDIFSKKSPELKNKQGETLAAHYNNMYFVVRRLNMNHFGDFYVRIAFGFMT